MGKVAVEFCQLKRDGNWSVDHGARVGQVDISEEPYVPKGGTALQVEANGVHVSLECYPPSGAWWTDLRT